ncbi:ABC transporter ATP-binding protein [Paraflavitalea sp. CAU 1676]|uniref:ABC transporter ATP-binding protein n=1 Tax=Paraflavitalea sp. CAU 1676 TaxID=3032598 RepID=UPI0023DCD0F6|nr:ABC transporter ATP-binding protein [Paraflavitalea sp. CAU 1676]MDF2192961.1 ABC transporter ATP-binding protein [Paraflavitalea sp. CAU 1676]
MDLLSVSGISKKDERGFELKAISFTQQKFQKIAIAGETGSGKSTLLKIIAGLAEQNAGVVMFEGKKIIGPADKLIPGHPGIVYLSQHFELPNNLRVEQVLEYANLLSDEAAATLYEICQIDHLLKRRTNQLSGGEKQRIALAKLLITSPKLLLLDEPFSNTDMVHKKLLKSVIRDIGAKLKITCIMVSHDPMDSLSWADSIIVIRDGALIQQGTPKEVYRQPASEYIAGLFGNFTLATHTTLKALQEETAAGNASQKLLVRPEDIIVSTSAGEGAEAMVKEVLYYGGFCDVEVTLGKNKLIARATNLSLAKGDTVYLRLNQSEHWYL